MSQEKNIIKNLAVLCTSTQRRQALSIIQAGFAAINTAAAVRRAVFYNAKKGLLEISGVRYELKNFQRILCVGFGKAALDAVSELQRILGKEINCGFVIDLKEGDLGNIVCRVGTHPHPTRVNIQATRELLAMLSGCGDKDLVLCVVSGGGSALLCYPNDMSCEVETGIMADLMSKGASIQEINTVRKHISKVKGGNLAKLMYPAKVVSLIFSDVPGDDLSMVASGPTVQDKTTVRDAKLVLEKYGVLESKELHFVRLLETPKEQKYFKDVRNVLAVSATLAVSAMKDRAEELGLGVEIFSTHFQGLASELGPQIVSKMSRRGSCLIGAGESTVKILGSGIGGRNQEMVLSALPELKEGQVLACAASDGHDNTEAAGAIGDISTLNKARHLKLDPEKFLANNDSFSFFERTGDLLQTGLTGSNVSDFFVCLWS